MVRTGNPKKALEQFDLIIKDHHDRINLKIDMIACYAALDMINKAQDYVNVLLKINPEFDVNKFLNNVYPVYKETYKKLLAKAGLKQNLSETED